jgi:glyoxylase-like metal-dependent hydrolase (beta-lactamase superfamily II)
MVRDSDAAQRPAPKPNNQPAGAAVPAWRDLGGISVCGLVTSRFRLDGGSMYGQVPKALWSRFSKADEENRIPLVVRSLLVRSGAALVLVDPGVGSGFAAEDRERLALDPRYDRLPELLSAAGIDSGAITHVVLTHLHFDHIAALGLPGPGGGLQPALPQARLIIHREQWARAQAPGPKERRSYRPGDLELLARYEQTIVDGREEVLPGLVVDPTEGHTRGLLVVEAIGRQERVIYPSDVIPTLAHLRLPYTTGFDLWPERLLEEKARILARAAEEAAILVFIHDPRTAACRIGQGAEGYVVREKILL